MPSAALRKIGEVAEATELSIKTIRHYDEVGLVEPSARSAGGFRLYTHDDVERLLTIRRMKPLGFSLDEMGEILQAMEVLASDDVSESSRTDARDVVRSYRSRVAESSRRLRTHLGYAEELSERLDVIVR